jgi:hypothetical protein
VNQSDTTLDLKVRIVAILKASRDPVDTPANSRIRRPSAKLVQELIDEIISLRCKLQPISDQRQREWNTIKEAIDVLNKEAGRPPLFTE